MANPVVDHLSLLNRAYQLVYALYGCTGCSIPTLTAAEACNLVAIVQDIRAGHIVTATDRALDHAMREAWDVVYDRMVNYIAGGRA